MAKYRQVHLTFWQDPFIEDLEPLEKYFYLYLMTNSKTTQCGCFEISMRLIKYETGLKQTQIDSYISMLEKVGKIQFDKINSEFFIVNWLKHNSFRSPKVQTCISKELDHIKTKKFKDFIYSIVFEKYPIDSLSIHCQTPIDTGSQQEQEQEQEQETQTNIWDRESFSEWDYKTAEWYNLRSIQNHPNTASLKKTNLKTGADVIRLLREQDCHNSEYITSVLEFAITDSFWIQNAQSISAIRSKSSNGLSKFENIASKMNQPSFGFSQDVDPNDIRNTF